MFALREELGKRLGGIEKSYKMADENRSMVQRVLIDKLDFLFTMIGAYGKQNLVASGERHLAEKGQEALGWERPRSPLSLGDGSSKLIRSDDPRECVNTASVDDSRMMVSFESRISH